MDLLAQLMVVYVNVAKPGLKLRGLGGQKPDSLCIIAEDVHDVGELEVYALEKTVDGVELFRAVGNG